MPYLKAEYTKNAEDFDKYYDYVIVCPDSENVHPKQAIQVRNKWMVDRSNPAVFWVEHENGGAYKMMKYAAHYDRSLIDLLERNTEQRICVKQWEDLVEKNREIMYNITNNVYKLV